MPTTPNFALPFPSLSDPPNVPADTEALAEAVDTQLAQVVHLAGGGVLTPPSVTSTITNYSQVYGASAWADQAAGVVTVPVAGVYQLTVKCRIAPPSALYDANLSVRDSGSGLGSQWMLQMDNGKGNLTVTCTIDEHLPAGHQVWSAVFIAGFSGNATVDASQFTVRLILPD